MNNINLLYDRNISNIKIQFNKMNTRSFTLRIKRIIVKINLINEHLFIYILFYVWPTCILDSANLEIYIRFSC